MSTTNTPSADSNPDSLGIKLTLLLLSTTTTLATTIISPALPGMAAHFSGTPNAQFLTQLSVTLPALFVVFVGSPVGSLADRIGRKPLLIGGTLLYTIAGTSGYYLSGLVFDSLYAVLVGRAVLGIAIGTIYVTTTVLITDYYTGTQRERMLGFQSAAISIVAVILLPIAGFLTTFSWRFPFLVYLIPIIFVPVGLVVLYEPQDTGSANRAAGIELLRGLAGRLPLRRLTLIYAILIVGEIAFYGVPTQIPFYLESLGSGGTAIGVALAVTTLFSALASVFVYERLRSRLAFGGIVAIFFGCFGVGYALVGAATTYALILVGLVGVGAGLGLLNPNQKSWASAVTPDENQGLALGGLTSVLFLGQFLSPLVIGVFRGQFGLAMTFASLGGILLVLAVGFAVFTDQASGEEATPAD